MPIYEYRCNSCGTVFEEIQKFSDAPVKVCKNCSSDKVEKLISQSSFVLKGTGWYATDYAKKDKKDSDAPAKPPCAGCPSC
ncbi:MAG: zinc ribbon domain-containing protein [Deltaproteobacteria bacterium]|nr:zinc ribbon domain-containing protein [Deltaproteobacteria bacterium]